MRCGTAAAPPDRGRGAGGERGVLGKQEEEEGEAAQGVDSYRHGAGKHQAERWSCFNEDASMTQASKGLVLYYFIFP